MKKKKKRAKKIPPDSFDLSIKADRALYQLVELAKNGNKRAAKTILRNASFLCREIEAMQRSNPNAWKPLAESLTHWPVLMSRVKAHHKEIALELKLLGLASKHPLNFTEGKYAGSKISEIARYLFYFVYYQKDSISPPLVQGGRIFNNEDRAAYTDWQSEAVKLPPLTKSKESYEKWWKAAQWMLLLEYGKELELHSDFAEISPKSLPAQRRDDIKKLLKQAFKSIAKNG